MICYRDMFCGSACIMCARKADVIKKKKKNPAWPGYGNSLKGMELWIDLEIAFFVKNHPPCPKQPDDSVSLLLTPRPWAVGMEGWIQGDLRCGPVLTSCGQDSASKLSFLPRWGPGGNHAEVARACRTSSWLENPRLTPALTPTTGAN